MPHYSASWGLVELAICTLAAVLACCTIALGKGVFDGCLRRFLQYPVQPGDGRQTCAPSELLSTGRPCAAEWVQSECARDERKQAMSWGSKRKATEAIRQMEYCLQLSVEQLSLTLDVLQVTRHLLTAIQSSTNSLSEPLGTTESRGSPLP